MQSLSPKCGVFQLELLKLPRGGEGSKRAAIDGLVTGIKLARDSLRLRSDMAIGKRVHCISCA
jgi:hypothetical protein